MERANTQPLNKMTLNETESAQQSSNSQVSSYQQSQDSMVSLKIDPITYNSEVKEEMLLPVNETQEFELSDRQPSQAFSKIILDDLHDEVFSYQRDPNRDYEKLYKLIESYIADPKLPGDQNKSQYMMKVKTRSLFKKYGKSRWLWPNNNPPIICLICNRTLRKSNYSNKHFYNCTKRNANAFFEDCKKKVDMDPNVRYQYFKLDEHAISIIVGVGTFLDTVIPWSLYADILEQKYKDYGKEAGLIDQRKMSKAPKLLFRIQQPLQIRAYHIVDKVEEIRAYQKKQAELALQIKKYKESKSILDNTQAFLELLSSFDSLDESAFEEFVAFAKTYSKQAQSFPVEKYITSDYQVHICIKDIKRSLTKLNSRQILDILIEACQHKMSLQRATGVMQIICSCALKALGTKDLNAVKLQEKKAQGKQSKGRRCQLNDTDSNVIPLIEHPVIQFMKEVMVDCCEKYQLSNQDFSQSQFLKKRVYKEGSKDKSKYTKDSEASRNSNQLDKDLKQNQREESKAFINEQQNQHIQDSQMARPSRIGTSSSQNPKPSVASSTFNSTKVLNGKRIEMPQGFSGQDKSHSSKEKLDQRTDVAQFTDTAQYIQGSDEEMIDESPLSEVVNDCINWTNLNIQQQQKINTSFNSSGLQAQVSQFLTNVQEEAKENQQQNALASSSFRKAKPSLENVVNERFPSQFNHYLKQSSERLQQKVQLVSLNQLTSKLQERQLEAEVNGEVEDQTNQTSRREAVQPLNTLGQKRRYQDTLLEVRRLHPHLQSDIDNCLLIDERVRQHIEQKRQKGELPLQDQDKQKNQEYYRSKRAKLMSQYSQVFFGVRPSAGKQTASKKCP